MHNCKTTRTNLIDLAFDETRSRARSAADERLLAELKECSACLAEYASLRHTLSVVNQTTRTAVPAESFWPGYHSRLSQRLGKAAATESLSLHFQPRTSARVWSTLKGIFGASVRVPVPVAAVVFLFFGLAMFLLTQARGPAKPGSLTPARAIETRIIEVPVIREKVVTRVVYVAKKRQMSPAQSEPARTQSLASATARLIKESANKTTQNLSGFRPTDSVKLTIIKGSYHDQK